MMTRPFPLNQFQLAYIVTQVHIATQDCRLQWRHNISHKMSEWYPSLRDPRLDQFRDPMAMTLIREIVRLETRIAHHQHRAFEYIMDPLDPSRNVSG